MKKFIYLAATVMLSASLFTACSDDDDVKKNNEGYIIKEVTFDGKGTKADPMVGGTETTINGSGFSTSSKLYARPASATREVSISDNAIELTVKKATESSITFATPFLYGTYELLQKEGNEIYTLGDIYFKAAKKATLIETFQNDQKTAYVTLEYDTKNRISEITSYTQIPLEEGFQKGDTHLYAYENDKLSKIITESFLSEISETTFKHDGNTITMTNEDDETPTKIFKLNDANQITEETYERIGIEYIPRVDDEGKPVLDEYGYEIFDVKESNHKYVVSYTYDAVGNLTATTSIRYEDDKLDESYKAEKDFKATYGTNKTFLAPGSVPSWYLAIYPKTKLPIASGIVNDMITFTSETGMFLQWDEIKYTYEKYDDELYPTEIKKPGNGTPLDPDQVYKITYE